MKTRINLICLSLTVLPMALAWSAPPPESPYSVPQPPFSGQVRVRTEYDQKAMADTAVNKPLLNSQLRTRLGFTASPSEKVEVKVEIQDVRFMGSETPPAATAANPATATTGNLKGVDLLQGYVAVEEGIFKTALGRQKMSLGAGRFLSTLEWSPTSRSFDGLSFNLKPGKGNLTGLAYLVRDTNTTVVDDRVLLTGLYYSHEILPTFTGDVYTFYDQSKLTTIYSGDTAQHYDLKYLGERVAGKFGMFTFEEEFIYQTGKLYMKTDKTSAAFQVAARVGAVMGDHKFNAGVDAMSGDKNPADNKVKTYRANYYFAHAYYGWMDYFVSNPKYGVIDYRLDGEFGFLPGVSGTPRVTLKPQYHYFMPQSAPAGAKAPYGQEVDAELHLALYPKSNIVLGAAVFSPGKSAYKLPAAKLKLNQNDKPGYFLYFMPMFNF